MAVLKNDESKEQCHQRPKGADAGCLRCRRTAPERLFQENFDVVLAFDGKRVDFKENRTEDLASNQAKLQSIYGGICEPEPTWEEFCKLEKATISKRDDLTLLLKNLSDSKGVKVFFSPLEEDWQPAGMSSQGVIDFVLTNDSDLTL